MANDVFILTQKFNDVTYALFEISEERHLRYQLFQIEKNQDIFINPPRDTKIVSNENLGQLEKFYSDVITYNPDQKIREEFKNLQIKKLSLGVFISPKNLEDLRLHMPT